MSQLLVRNLDARWVQKLMQRAAEAGISTEEAHRRLLKEALEKPIPAKPTLIEFLSDPDQAVCPDTDLDLSRSDDHGNRDVAL